METNVTIIDKATNNLHTTSHLLTQASKAINKAIPPLQQSNLSTDTLPSLTESVKLLSEAVEGLKACAPPHTPLHNTQKVIPPNHPMPV